MKRIIKKVKIGGLRFKKAFIRVLNGSQQYLTLDIGSHAIKMVEYSVDENKIHVVNGFIVPTPSDSVLNGKIIDMDKIVEIIKPKIKNAKIVTKRLSISVESDEIISREMLIPKLKENEYNSFITANSADIFPMNLTSYSLGYSIIEEYCDKGVDMNRIMIVAIPKEIVQKYIELATILKLNLENVIYSGYELYNFIDFEIPPTEEGYAVIDFGAKTTNLIVMSKKVLRFNRVISKGSDNITQKISKELECNLVKAEQLKKQYNSVIILGKLKKDADVYKVAKITQDVISDVIQDALRIIEFYNINNAKNKILKIYLTGLGSKISGIEEYVEGLVGIPVIRIKSFNNVVFEGEARRLRNRQLTLINCLGSNALKQNSFNFIKGDLKFSTVNLFKSLLFYECVACGVLIVLFIAAAINLNIFLVNQKTKEYNSFIASNYEITKVQDEIAKEKLKINNTNQILNRIGVGAEVHRDKLENIEKVIDEMSEKVKIDVKRYEIYPDFIRITCRATSLKVNYLEDMDYINAPYDLEDKLNGYFEAKRGNNPKPESFTLTLNFKE